MSIREAIARALYDQRAARQDDVVAELRKAYGENLGGGVFPYEVVRDQHLAEADAVIEAITSAIGWPEINAYRDELSKGQDIREDAGGYFARAIGALFGRESGPVETYKKAAERLLRDQ